MSNEEQEMNEALQRDAHRIFAYLERHIAPSDVDTVKYLMGIIETKNHAQMPLGWGGSEYEEDAQLFV